MSTDSSALLRVLSDARLLEGGQIDAVRGAFANRPPGEGEDATAEGAGAEDAGEDATCGPKRRKGGGRRRAPTGLEDKRRILDWLLEQAETPGNIQTINKLRGEIAVLLERLRR